MGYFYMVHAVAGKDEETTFFMPFEGELKDGKPPLLSAETVRNDAGFINFAKKSMKKIYVDYFIYETEDVFSNIASIHREQYFNELVKSSKANRVSSGELTVENTKKAVKKEKAAPVKKTKKRGKSSKVVYIISSMAVIVSLILGIGIGMRYVAPAEEEKAVITEPTDENLSGLIIPTQTEINPDAEQITVSIDFSWSAIPKEDIQVKGEVVDGVAEITLPYFDRRDFFAHVPGHTWGFTSDPNGEKIEFHGGETYKFTENIKLYRVLVKYGGGNGTKDDPYIINYYDQLQLIAAEEARGYFRQTEDLYFPQGYRNTPIYTVNELKDSPQAEHFEYDGGGFRISGLTAPMFGRVSGSLIQNVNIINSYIETHIHTYYGFIAAETYNYRYEADGVTYETGETIIRNCTVSDSTINIRPKETIEENSEENSPIPPGKRGEYAIGGITGIGGQIENCFITEINITSSIDEYFLYVGGVSGKPANVINSGVVGLTISGNIFTAGGITGSAGGSRLYSADGRELPVYYGGNIRGSFVRNFNAYVENSAGGIAGEASTYAENSMISNSYATGLNFSVGIFEDEQRTRIIRRGVSGGVIGADGNEANGHLITNAVSPMEYAVIGIVRTSVFDETVRVAPSYAFYQTSILDVINRNTVITADTDNPEIFTGCFIFGGETAPSDEAGNLPFPTQITELFKLTVKEEN